MTKNNKKQEITSNIIIIKLHIMNIKNNIISLTTIQTQQSYTIYMNSEEMKIISEINITKYIHKFYLSVKQQSSVVTDFRVQLINQNLKK